MAHPHKRQCIDCIPYRIGVIIISCFVAIFGGLSIGLQGADERSSMEVKVSSYIGGAIYILLAISGCLAAQYKTYKIVCYFSVFWWIATLLTILLNTLAITLYLTVFEGYARDVCFETLTEAFDFMARSC
ncbi:hypothetical protein BGW39_005706 [Mortierella sp. 14UC]|nr:hypothetical protein BGW39_005706 [Mortierella sp. 14UC]